MEKNIKTFKQYLQEDMKEVLTHVADRLDLEDVILRLSVNVPLSSSIFKRLNELERKRAFHVLSYRRLDDLEKIEGTKKSISCFTTAGYGSIMSGVEGGSGIVAFVEGDKIVRGDRDLYTTVDQQGRRWMTLGLNFLKISKEVKSVREKLSKKIFKTSWRDLLLGYNMTSDGSGDNEPLPDVWSEDKKGKGKFIKEYIDAVEKILKKYIEEFKYGLYPREVDRNIGVDEVVMNKIKVLKVYVIDESLKQKGYEDSDIKKIMKDLKKDYKYKFKLVKNIDTFQRLVKIVRKEYDQV